MNWRSFRYGFHQRDNRCSYHGCGARAYVRACIQLKSPTWIYACSNHKEAWD